MNYPHNEGVFGIAIDVKVLRKLCREDKIKWTLHILKRMGERSISSELIINTILKGKIIEEYSESCLILNFEDARPLHVVVGMGGEEIFIVTAYFPTLEKWDASFENRKE